MKYKLEEIATYSNKKIEIDKVNLGNYISTENMLSTNQELLRLQHYLIKQKLAFLKHRIY